MKFILTSIMMMLYISAFGQGNDSLQADTIKTQNLNNVTITSRRASTRKMGGAVNGVMINKEELFKAACCNLGESFTTNPSVDVNYSDAATGAKQIKLLGLVVPTCRCSQRTSLTSVGQQPPTPSTMYLVPG